MKNNPPPHFSIIIPTLNRDKRLRLAINSVVEQSFTDFELIIVDDGSANDVQAVINEFNDARIKIVRNQKSLGAAAARNKGIEAACGEWVVFLDDDDVFYSNRLESAVQGEMENPDAIFGFCAVEKAYEKLNKKKVFLPAVDEASTFALRLSTSVLTVRREELQAIGGFDTSFQVSEDRDLVLGLVVNGGDFYVSDKPLVKRVFHNETQLSKRIGFYRQACSDENLLSKYSAFILQKPELYSFVSVLIANSYSRCSEYSKAANYYSTAADNASSEVVKYRLKALQCRIKSFFFSKFVR